MNNILSLNNIAKAIGTIICALAVDFYLFPINSIGAYGGPNTKVVLAIVGSVLFLIGIFNEKKNTIPLQLIFATLIAFLFSTINYLSTEINATSDYGYSNYFVSFFTWTFSAYTVAELIRVVHREVNLRLITSYFLAVCLFQCVIALLIDNIPMVAYIVDNYLTTGNQFVKEGGRLYGIGASLDPAGVRFAVTLTMAAFVMTQDELVYGSSSSMRWFICSFLIISIIGNMISRTTLIGVVIGLIVIIGSYFANDRNGMISLQPMINSFLAILSISILASILIYNVSAEARSLFRFGFEGFFSFFETGVWQTGSTDVLQTMWIWPTDLQGWIIGYGIFEDWFFGTDIGYCRFVLYSGLCGLTIFAIFFIYQLLSFCKAIPNYRLLFILLLIIVFVVWIKVSTDIYYVVALFYWLDEFQSKYKIAAV